MLCSADYHMLSTDGHRVKSSVRLASQRSGFDDLRRSDLRVWSFLNGREQSIWQFLREGCRRVGDSWMAGWLCRHPDHWGIACACGDLERILRPAYIIEAVVTWVLLGRGSLTRCRLPVEYLMLSIPIATCRCS